MNKFQKTPNVTSHVHVQVFVWHISWLRTYLKKKLRQSNVSHRNWSRDQSNAHGSQFDWNWWLLIEFAWNFTTLYLDDLVIWVNSDLLKTRIVSSRSNYGCTCFDENWMLAILRNYTGVLSHLENNWSLLLYLFVNILQICGIEVCTLQDIKTSGAYLNIYSFIRNSNVNATVKYFKFLLYSLNPWSPYALQIGITTKLLVWFVEISGYCQSQEGGCCRKAARRKQRMFWSLPLNAMA